MAKRAKRRMAIFSPMVTICSVKSSWIVFSSSLMNGCSMRTTSPYHLSIFPWLIFSHCLWLAFFLERGGNKFFFFRDNLFRNIFARKIGRIRSGNVHRKVIAKCDEVLVARDEIRLAEHFNEHADLAGCMDVRMNAPLAGGTIRLLCRLRDTFLAKFFGCFFKISADLFERLLGVHHARSGHLAKHCNSFGINGHRDKILDTRLVLSELLPSLSLFQFFQ